MKNLNFKNLFDSKAKKAVVAGIATIAVVGSIFAVTTCNKPAEPKQTDSKPAVTDTNKTIKSDYTQKTVGQVSIDSASDSGVKEDTPKPTMYVYQKASEINDAVKNNTADTNATYTASNGDTIKTYAALTGQVKEDGTRDNSVYTTDIQVPDASTQKAGNDVININGEAYVKVDAVADVTPDTPVDVKTPEAYTKDDKVPTTVVVTDGAIEYNDGTKQEIKPEYPITVDTTKNDDGTTKVTEIKKDDTSVEAPKPADNTDTTAATSNNSNSETSNESSSSSNYGGGSSNYGGGSSNYGGGSNYSSPSTPSTPSQPSQPATPEPRYEEHIIVHTTDGVAHDITAQGYSSFREWDMAHDAEYTDGAWYEVVRVRVN
jgi:hypothetical protein